MNFSQEVKHRITARQVFDFYGLKINKAGFCRCPFHAGDNTGSLKVYDGFRGWHCFACDAGHSVIDFVMQYFGLSCYEAVKKLNEDFRLGLPIGEPLSAEQREEADRKAAEMIRKRKERDEAHSRLHENYQKALDVWIWLDTIRRQNAPKSPQDGFCESYVFAVKNIDQFGEELDEATDALLSFEKTFASDR